MPMTSEETVVKSSRRTHRDAVNGGRQWRARCKLSEWESKQPRASGGSKSKHTPTPLCKEKKTLWYSSNGNRWERSFTAGASACYRGHKSAAWHRVSSVSQQSQDCGHVSINGPTDELTARDEQAERRPRTTTSSAWDTTHRKERHISSFIKRRKTETTTFWKTAECKSSLQVRDMGHTSLKMIITAALTCCHTYYSGEDSWIFSQTDPSSPFLSLFGLSVPSESPLRPAGWTLIHQPSQSCFYRVDLIWSKRGEKEEDFTDDVMKSHRELFKLKAQTWPWPAVDKTKRSTARWLILNLWLQFGWGIALKLFLITTKQPTPI